jgi:DNA-directed RNA polymerase specialized sigma24 family protein
VNLQDKLINKYAQRLVKPASQLDKLSRDQDDYKQIFRLHMYLIQHKAPTDPTEQIKWIRTVLKNKFISILRELRRKPERAAIFSKRKRPLPADREGLAEWRDYLEEQLTNPGFENQAEARDQIAKLKETILDKEIRLLIDYTEHESADSVCEAYGNPISKRGLRKKINKLKTQAQRILRRN